MTSILKNAREIFCTKFPKDKSTVTQKSLTDFVKDTLTENKVTIFSKSYCPFCIQAKDLFDDLRIDYKAIELNEHKNGTEIQALLADITKQTTVPNIFINQKHIGGFSDLQNVHKSGDLKKLLGEANFRSKL